MAELDAKSKKLAKRLATLVVARGAEVVGQVGPALEKLLGARPLAERRAFLKTFRRFLERGLRARQLLVEHAGPLNADDLEVIVKRFAGSEADSLTILQREEPALLGGVRVTLGDNVYDASVAGQLARLSQPTA